MKPLFASTVLSLSIIITSSSFATHSVFSDTWVCVDDLPQGRTILVAQNVGSIDACIQAFITYLGVQIFPQCFVTGFSLIGSGVTQTGEVFLARYDFTLACPGLSSGKHRTLEAARIRTNPSHQSIVKLSPLTASQEAPDVIASVEPDKTTKTLVAKVFNAETGQLVPNVGVKLELDVVEQSGGHDHHDANRPKGEFGSPSGAANPDRTVLNGNTGVNGLQFSFKAPAPAGDHTVTASCTDRTCTQEGPDTIEVGIKELIPMLFTNVYELIGETNTHPNNHFLTPVALSRITFLAALYNAEFPSNSILHLNDASLIHGGLFDVGSTRWAPPHHEHRRGTVVDIRANNLEGAIPERNYLAFERLAGALGVVARLERKFRNGQEVIGERHYHVRLFGRSE